MKNPNPNEPEPKKLLTTDDTEFHGYLFNRVGIAPRIGEYYVLTYFNASGVATTTKYFN